ncbi:sigma-54-dependent Fis family transcriptional regulator [Rheinheimera sp. YQF-2]|uniref:Sigma-54-dependent Fis family transcriptional regulator n=1 Tax=Rheinheimera lutimaris TaxID=2740584 RepID=A0A7Y5EL73_9GAMM|nr:sigma-54 dependent transcriptional regulator [Rheinheimera lutimaris]NRQ42898.1 sigma-54-dependent Fis family transcriptional regulator [Rheinheimera lutimaris]
MSQANYVLWIAQQQPDAEVQQCIRSEGYQLLHTAEVTEIVGLCQDYQPALAFIDCDLPQMALPDLVSLVCRKLPAAQIISMVGNDQSELASDTLQSGAIDYLLKPFFCSQLKTSIRNATAMSRGLKDLVAVSHASRQILQLANRAAQTEASVLILGESGTGKERLAQFIHQASDRADKPFIAVNCAAIPEHMLEAMLFGYNKGAFTGAVNQQIGKFEAANGGTILLDEISELPLALQAKLLRVLQEREVERLGSNSRIKLDIRVIAASNKNLRSQVEQGLFREDLFYRLDVLPLSWPALRERRDDILPLAEFFINKYGNGKYRLSRGAADVMLQYNWPGNVRELENIMQRALVMARGIELQIADLNLPQCHPQAAAICASLLKQSKKDAEFDYILNVLNKFNGHRTRTAQALGVSTRALRYKIAAMREHGVDIDALAS